MEHQIKKMEEKEVEKAGEIASIAEVAVVKCSDYKQEKVDKAVEAAFSLIKFDPKNRTKVLIKPNLVMLGDAKKQAAITTNISVIEAVCKFLKNNECKIYIGESSFMNTPGIFESLGINKLAERYNAEIVIFEQSKLVRVKNLKAKVLEELELPEILNEVDYVINLPKLKTHTLARVTLGVKNLYGLIPGGLKQRLHNIAHGKKFSEILVDIYQTLIQVLEKPVITLIDGIIGMEGEGPAAGIPKNSGLIIASKNAVALDICASKIMGFRPRKIYTNRFAVKESFITDINSNCLE
jgi:uncharacterized protein (DUF362 family)